MMGICKSAWCVIALFGAANVAQSQDTQSATAPKVDSETIS